VFVVAALLSLVGLSLSLGLGGQRSSLREAAHLYLSFANLKTLVDLYHFDAAREPRKRETILVSLKYNATPFALTEIRRILKNPLSPETEEVLKSLFTHPRPKLLPDILELARDQGAYHRATALFALGAYPRPEVVECLVACLDDPSPRIRSNAAKSLGRVGAGDHLASLKSRVDDPDNSTWDLMNYTIAILNLEPRGDFAGRFFELTGRSNNKSYKQSLFSLFSRYRGVDLELNAVYQAENLAPGTGVALFLDEARQIEAFHQATDLKTWLVGDHRALGLWVSRLWVEDHDSLAASVTAEARALEAGQPCDDTTALALAYFAWSVLVERDEAAAQ